MVGRKRKFEVNVELLLGRGVYAQNGRRVGRLEEVRASLEKGACFVDEYLVGNYALFERLASLHLGRALLHTFGLRSHGYRVPWDKLDLTDPARPRLLCTVAELEKL